MNASYFSFLLTFFLIFSGCGHKKTTVVVNDKTYTFVRKSHLYSNGVMDVELWSRKGVTNFYYTPSLTKLDMIPLMK